MPIASKIGSVFSKMLKSKGGKVLDDVQGLATGTSIPKTRKQWKSAGPWIPPVLYGTAVFGNEAVVNPIQEAIRGPSNYESTIKEARVRKAQKINSLKIKMEYEEMQRKMARAAMQLAASDPHLYNEIMAGRQLPKDAVVFGGQPRTDIMEELAMGMAQGQFNQQPSAQDELMQSLGV